MRRKMPENKQLDVAMKVIEKNGKAFCPTALCGAELNGDGALRADRTQYFDVEIVEGKFVVKWGVEGDLGWTRCTNCGQRVDDSEWAY